MGLRELNVMSQVKHLLPGFDSLLTNVNHQSNSCILVISFLTFMVKLPKIYMNKLLSFATVFGNSEEQYRIRLNQTIWST